MTRPWMAIHLDAIGQLAGQWGGQCPDHQSWIKAFEQAETTADFQGPATQIQRELVFRQAEIDRLRDALNRCREDLMEAHQELRLIEDVGVSPGDYENHRDAGEIQLWDRPEGGTVRTVQVCSCGLIHHPLTDTHTKETP